MPIRPNNGTRNGIPRQTVIVDSTSGCSVVLRGGGQRWTYVYGNLDPEQGGAEIVLDGVTRYRDTADGLVPWRERPTF